MLILKPFHYNAYLWWDIFLIIVLTWLQCFLLYVAYKFTMFRLTGWEFEHMFFACYIFIFFHSPWPGGRKMLPHGQTHVPLHAPHVPRFVSITLPSFQPMCHLSFGWSLACTPWTLLQAMCEVQIHPPFLFSILSFYVDDSQAGTATLAHPLVFLLLFFGMFIILSLQMFIYTTYTVLKVQILPPALYLWSSLLLIPHSCLFTHFTSLGDLWGWGRPSFSIPPVAITFVSVRPPCILVLWILLWLRHAALIDHVPASLVHTSTSSQAISISGCILYSLLSIEIWFWFNECVWWPVRPTMSLTASHFASHYTSISPWPHVLFLLLITQSYLWPHQPWDWWAVTNVSLTQYLSLLALFPLPHLSCFPCPCSIYTNPSLSALFVVFSIGGLSWRWVFSDDSTPGQAWGDRQGMVFSLVSVPNFLFTFPFIMCAMASLVWGAGEGHLC